MEKEPFLLPGERLDEVNEHLSLIQKPEGLTFGTDALLLAAFVKGEPQASLLELGGGSGIISMLLAARQKCRRAVCAEIQPDYVDLIRRNVALNGLEGVILPLLADARNPAELGAAEEYDTVVTNPPYLPRDGGEGNRNPAKNIARREVMGGIRSFARSAARMLRWGGRFYCVYRPDRLEELFASLREAGLSPKRLTPVMAHTEALPSLVLLEARRGGGEGLVMTKPFYLKTQSGEDTPEMIRLLEHGTLEG